MVKEEVGGELFVLVAGKVSLDGLVSVEAEAAQPLDGITLLLGDRNSLGTRGERNIVIGIFTKKLEELIGIRGNELSKLRVAGAKLLEDGLEHLWLLLDNLAELLELGVMSQEVEVTQVTTLAGSSRSSSRGGGLVATASSPTRTASLSSEIEQVDIATLIGTTVGSRLSGRGLSSRGGMVLLLLLLLFLLDVFGDSLKPS